MAEEVTVEDVETKYHAMRKFYKQRNSNMLLWRDMYFRDEEQYFLDRDGNYIEAEPDERRFVVPSVTNIVETMRELLLTKAPAVSVPQPTAKAEDLVHAEHNEKALQSTWSQGNILEDIKDSLWHALCSGWGVLQIKWEDESESYESPVQVIAHDPYNIYACPTRRLGKWQYVINTYPVLVANVKDAFAKDLDGRTKEAKDIKEALEGLTDDKKVTLIDYWDDEYHGIAINYEQQQGGTRQTLEITDWIQRPEKHGYGFLPWIIYFPCRLPFKDMGRRMGVPVFWRVSDIIRELTYFASKKATMLDRWQDPPLVTRTIEGRDFEPVRTEAGLHLRLEPEESASYLVNPTPMPQMDSHLEFLQSELEKGSIPRVLQGQYIGRVSGVAMSLLRNPTLMKVAFKQKSLESALEKMNMYILLLLEKKLSEPRYAWGRNEMGEGVDVMIDPEQIAGYYRNEVQLSASLPTDDASTMNILAMMVQLDIISAQTARDVAQRTLHEILPQSLTEEEERVVAEKILQNEAVLQALAQATAGDIVPVMQNLQKQQGENPRGGRGERAVRPPAQTMPSQVPTMPGGNTQPSNLQRQQDLMRERAGAAGQRSASSGR
jgi:hypothetical protein